MSLDKKLRVALEEEIDDMIKDPAEREETIRKILVAQGIDPNLDAILSQFSGWCFHKFWTYYILEYDRNPTDDEIDEYIDLMKRRTWEMRQAFLTTRLE